MKLSDLANPKNSWLLLYERSLLNQFLGLLVEINKIGDGVVSSGGGKRFDNF